MNQSEYIKNNLETYGRTGVYIWTPIGTKVSREIGNDIRPCGTITNISQDKKGKWIIQINNVNYHMDFKEEGGRFQGLYDGSFSYCDPHL
jgi:hypothetical protein